jgi:hypothetical protein
MRLRITASRPAIVRKRCQDNGRAEIAFGLARELEVCRELALRSTTIGSQFPQCYSLDKE